MALEHISDTARWVAVYRAMETERPDAIFRDPYARQLAGARGEAIAREVPRALAMAWAMIVRTALFDDFIMDAVHHRGVTVVVDLATGLDTRAWRLPLPASLQWVDADFAPVLDYKTQVLASERPSCRYEAVPTDLKNAADRAALLDRVGGSAKALVITEGLLVYLAADQVATLARDLHARPGYQWWLTDLGSPRLLRFMNRSWGRAVSGANAPFLFGPAEGPAFFTPHGWHEVSFRSTWEEASRLDREMRGAWLWQLLNRLSARGREESRKMSGTLLLERTSQG